MCLVVLKPSSLQVRTYFNTFKAQANASWPDEWVSPRPPLNSNLSIASKRCLVEVKGPWVRADGAGRQSEAYIKNIVYISQRHL